MKALVFQGPNHFEIEERPVPEPGAGEALVRVLAIGICGSDIHGFTGQTGRRAPGMIMGHEIVARVEGVGGDDTIPSELRDVPVAVSPMIPCGECVFCRTGRDTLCRSRRLIGVDADIQGGFAEFMVAPVRNLVPLDNVIPSEWGALVEPFSVGYRAALLGEVKEGEPLVVVGGGMIGLASLAAGKRLGASPTILSEPMAHRRSAAERMGALVVDPRNESLTERVLEATDGAGAPCVLECVGTTATIGAAIAAAAPGGNIVLVGMESPRVEIALYEVITQERRLVGNLGYTQQRFRETAEWLCTRPSTVDGLIEARTDFVGAQERFRALAAGEDPSIKVIVQPTADGFKSGGV